MYNFERNEKIGGRIKKIRHTLNLTQLDLAKTISLSQVRISHIESGRTELNIRIILDLSNKLNIDIYWLLSGKGKMFKNEIDQTEISDQINIKVEGEISAGCPVETGGEDLDIISIGKNLLPDTNDYYCFRVNGKSMEPDILHEDLVVIKRDINWENNENNICAVRIDGEITLKQVDHDKEKKVIILTSKNTKYKPIIVNLKYSEVTLIGSIYLIIRKVDYLT